MRKRAHINIHIFLCGCFESHETNECHKGNVLATFLCSIIGRKRALLRWGGGGALEGCWFFRWPVEPVEFLPIYVTYPPWAWWCSLMEPRQGPGTRGRKNRHIQDTNIIPITDWSLVQGNLGRNRLETWEDIGMHCLSLLTIGSFLTVLIVRGSTRRYRHDLSQVGRILGLGF